MQGHQVSEFTSAKSKAGDRGALATQPPRQKSLLVVEDDTHARFALARRLSSAGFHVEAVATAEEAVAAALTYKIDAITLDVRLPDFDGVEVAVQIRTFPELQKTPIVFITGGVDATLKGACHRLRNCYFIRKPCDTSLLIQLLNIVTGSEDPREIDPSDYEEL
jgi:DNA-binding response OmpR family regulator